MGKNFVGKIFVRKKKLVGKIIFVRKKIIGKKFYQKKKLSENYFLSESGGCDKHDLICIFVYQLGRLCGGTHEISDIKAHFFSMGGWWGGWCAGKEWGE